MNRWEPYFPKDNVLSRGKNWVELRKHMPNYQIYQPHKLLLLLTHLPHWHQGGGSTKEDRGQKNEVTSTQKEP